MARTATTARKKDNTRLSIDLILSGKLEFFFVPISLFFCSLYFVIDEINTSLQAKANKTLRYYSEILSYDLHIEELIFLHL